MPSLKNFSPPRKGGAESRVALWLFLCCALVFAMVTLGGYTRLSGSGLSIPQWRPVTGTLPPINAAAWHEAFDLYRATPEYRQINKGMELEEFQRIYLVEYAHRLLGRLTGAVFLVPFLWFLYWKALPRPMIGRLVAIFFLGGAQGAMGWFMVKSGLADDPRVSPYRLAAHLLLALWIYSLLLLSALNIWRGERCFRPSLPGAILMVLIVLQIGMGAIVAGLDAGLAYNTFPTMNGQFLPDGLLALSPVWRNLFENPTTAQFLHRLLALVVLLAAIGTRVTAPSTRSADILLALIFLQMGLGIWTLLGQVSLLPALLHQANAVLILTAALLASRPLRSTEFRAYGQLP